MVLKRTGSRMDLALIQAATGVFPQAKKDARKVLVLFTDVSPVSNHGPIQKALDSLNKQGVTVIVVGVGSKVKLTDLVKIVEISENVIIAETSKTLLYYYYDVYHRIVSCKYLFVL